MAKVQTTFLFLICIFWVAFGWSTPQTSIKPLYLSYEKRLVLTYLLAGAGESKDVQVQITERLKKTLIRYYNAVPTEVKVKSFPEFLQYYQGPWPESYSVQSDLQLVENENFRGPILFRAVSQQGRDNPALQSQINGFIINQNERMLEKTRVTESPVAMLAPCVDFILSAKDKSWKDRINLIDFGFEKATEVLNKQFLAFEKVGEQIATSGKLSNLDPSMRLFLETVLQEYFSRLSVKSKKQMLSRFLGLSLTASPMDQFEVMLMSAGPQFQKLLQIVSGNSKISKDLSLIFKKLESKVSPIPAPIVEKLFEAERDRYKWISYELAPLGTGTMAQVHKGQIPGPNGPQPVVIRFLKPEIEDRVAEDARILTEIAEVMDQDNRFREAKLPKLKPIVQDLNKTVADELVLSATIDLQQKARQVYNRTTLVDVGGYKNYVRIHVPFVVEGGPDSQLMVQELMEGRKLGHEVVTYQEAIPQLAKALMEHLATVWTTEAFFASGLFHADLHQGNFLVNVTDQEILLPPLDFGMGGVLTKDLQENLLLFGIGIKLQRSDLIAMALWSSSLTHLNTVNELSFASQVVQHLEELRRQGANLANPSEWMNWASDAGLRFPYELISLNRGMVIIDQALKDVNSHLTVGKLSENLFLRYGKATLLKWYKEKTLSSSDLLKLGLATVKTEKPLIPFLTKKKEVGPQLCYRAHRKS